jgi:hypothetical protein
MEMELVPSPGKTVEYRCRLLRQERQRLPLFQRARERSEGTVEGCSLCRRVLTPTGWLELRNVPESLGLGSEAPPSLRETLCPDCSARLRKAIQSG